MSKQTKKDTDEKLLELEVRHSKIGCFLEMMGMKLASLIESPHDAQQTLKWISKGINEERIKTQ